MIPTAEFDERGGGFLAIFSFEHQGRRLWDVGVDCRHSEYPVVFYAGDM